MLGDRVKLVVVTAGTLNGQPQERGTGRPDDIIELHAGSTWTTLFLGFAPGFAYLGPLPPDLATARRATPRERVPAGSVAIGGDQTAVYPFELPGGWQVIGRTEATMWDIEQARPNLLAPGDRVRFVPIR